MVMVTGLLAMLGSPALAQAREPIPDRFDFMDPRPANEVVIQAMTLSNFAGVNLGYRRAFGRHISLGGILEYAYPDAGYGQIQALGHTVEAIGWIKRPWTGVYFAATFTVGHNFLFNVPAISSVALGGGASMGWSWDLTPHLNVGVSGGLRFMSMVKQAPEICTLPSQCVMVEENFVPRFALTFGYRF